MPLSRTQLLIRNLRHFRAANLAVVAGMAVATAVLGGALMVGDSVRSSLRDLALARLAWVDHAMVATRMIPQSLATRIQALPEFQSRFDSITPGITLRGSVATEDNAHHAPGVQITALGGAQGVAKDQAIVNGELSEALDYAAPGAALRFSIPAPDDTPGDATLAKRGRNETIASIAAAKSGVATSGGFRDLFNLAGGQRVPRLAWVNLQALQDELQRPEQANLFLVSSKPGHDTAQDAQALTRMLRQTATLKDYGLETLISRNKSDTIITSAATFVHPAVVSAVEELAAEQKTPLRKVNVYLVNNVVRVTGSRDTGGGRDRRDRPSGRTGGFPFFGGGGGSGGSGGGGGSRVTTRPSAATAPTTQSGPTTSSAGRPASAPSVRPEPVKVRDTIHYAICAGVSDLDGKPLKDNEAAVNQWTADQMGLKVGDTLRLDYYQRQINGELVEVRSDRGELRMTFTVTRILPMTGIGADPTLTPEYKGLTDADAIADWRPPAGLNINKKLVTREDEKYWSDHKAAPKLFISLSAASILWGSAHGDVTSLRMPADKAGAVLAQLAQRIDPEAMGMAFRPIKQQQLAAASGGTDFAGLFIGFSFFLLISAVLLVAMLFRLSVEQRSRQMGLMAACGFAPSQIRNMALKEGFLLALSGGVIGILAGIGYTALMIHGLRTWWVDAIGTTALRLHLLPMTLGIGLVAGIFVAMLAVMWATRRIAKMQPAGLLAGALGTSEVRRARPARLTLPIGIIAAIAAIGLFGAAAYAKVPTEAGFLGGGTLLLVACLMFVFARLRPRHRVTVAMSLGNLAMKNASRNRARSLLCVALIALASFVIVTVSSMQSDTPTNTFDRLSGSGGYGLIVQTDIPLKSDLNTLEGRKILMRLGAASDTRWNKARFIMMRSWAGQDASCLNITRPDSPTILAVPPSLAFQTRFSFARTLAPASNPWTLLEDPRLGVDAIPVIADDETARYILKLGLGETLTITDPSGRPRKLKLVATLSGSIFQSELLMSESKFMALFPIQSGYSTILVETAPSDLPTARTLLNEVLNDVAGEEKSDYSAVIQTTADRLHAYHEVANTYLSTFQVLGSLGLMLGTVGLAVVMIRNLVERRSELALLASLGYSDRRRSRLVLAENLALLLLGLLIGAGSALAGVIPHTLTSAHRVNVPALSVSLSAVLVVGIASLLVAIQALQKRISPAALRAE